VPFYVLLRQSQSSQKKKVGRIAAGPISLPPFMPSYLAWSMIPLTEVSVWVAKSRSFLPRTVPWFTDSK
jgi:hypothetical protein